MLNRLENAMKNGEKITGADASFYMHELVLISTLSDGGLVRLIDGIEQNKSQKRKIQFRLCKSLS